MNPIQTIREALEILRGAVGHADTIAAADRALTALAELEKQERDGPNWNPLPGWQQLADGTSCYTTTASTDQVAGEPVAWQRRMRPTWGSHSACPWSPWEPCTKGQAEDHWKTPLLHDWAYEARALCLAAPVAQQPQAEASPTAGMNMAQRILHVGGRNNAAGYVEFGSVQAVEALVRHVLRDLPKPRRIPDHELVSMYDECPRSDSDMIAFAHEVMDAMLAAAPKGQP